MRPTLPRPFGRKSSVLGILVAWGCQHDRPPVAPPDPIRAEREIALGSADTECVKFVAALEHYGACPHATDDERAWAKRVGEVFAASFQTTRRNAPDAEADRVMAHACHRAAQSVTDATARCATGKPPASEE